MAENESIPKNCATDEVDEGIGWMYTSRGDDRTDLSALRSRLAASAAESERAEVDRRNEEYLMGKKYGADAEGRRPEADPDARFVVSGEKSRLAVRTSGFAMRYEDPMAVVERMRSEVEEERRKAETRRGALLKKVEEANRAGELKRFRETRTEKIRSRSRSGGRRRRTSRHRRNHSRSRSRNRNHHRCHRDRERDGHKKMRRRDFQDYDDDYPRSRRHRHSRSRSRSRSHDRIRSRSRSRSRNRNSRSGREVETDKATRGSRHENEEPRPTNVIGKTAASPPVRKAGYGLLRVDYHGKIIASSDAPVAPPPNSVDIGPDPTLIAKRRAALTAKMGSRYGPGVAAAESPPQAVNREDAIRKMMEDGDDRGAHMKKDVARAAAERERMLTEEDGGGDGGGGTRNGRRGDFLRDVASGAHGVSTGGGGDLASRVAQIRHTRQRPGDDSFL